MFIKRYLLLLLIIVVIFSFTGCANNTYEVPDKKESDVESSDIEKKLYSIYNKEFTIEEIEPYYEYTDNVEGLIQRDKELKGYTGVAYPTDEPNYKFEFDTSRDTYDYGYLKLSDQLEEKFSELIDILNVPVHTYISGYVNYDSHYEDYNNVDVSDYNLDVNLFINQEDESNIDNENINAYIQSLINEGVSNAFINVYFVTNDLFEEFNPTLSKFEKNKLISVISWHGDKRINNYISINVKDSVIQND